MPDIQDPAAASADTLLAGLIGGVSPEATVLYYRHLNTMMRGRFGGQHSAPVMIAALDYGRMIADYHARDWPAFTQKIVDAGRRLEDAGAAIVAITSNTTHIAAEALSEALSVPVLHMLDPLAERLRTDGRTRPLLLGTPVVMQADFYRAAFDARFPAGFAVPSPEEQNDIERIILDELVEGVVLQPSLDRFNAIINRQSDCDCVILGCTELCLILDNGRAAKPAYDTTAIHAEAIFDAMTSDIKRGRAGDAADQ